ncbi:hypothetical protein SUVC_11G1110 [Saccharomyces uvarum]|uniref:Uncharacterized protein n=1 Tax=Saccharomyces uvarum TaxID=230603 RepID=A0AA35NI36_SACUV|nr:hypothetical protein SUVC_11G1110 [Saccharomyces uvarum]
MPSLSKLRLTIGSHASDESNGHTTRRAKLMEGIFRIKSIWATTM